MNKKTIYILITALTICIILSIIFGTNLSNKKLNNNLSSVSTKIDTNTQIKQLEYFTNIDPKNINYLMRLGEVYEANNKDDKAIEVYNKVLSISPKYALANFRLGNINLKKGMFDTALEQYKKSIEADKNNSYEYMMVSEILLLNDNEKALNYAQQSYDLAKQTKADGLQFTEMYLQYVKDIRDNNKNKFDSCIKILNNYIIFDKLKVELGKKFINELPEISDEQKQQINKVSKNNGGIN